jgi:hypothetical protein
LQIGTERITNCGRIIHKDLCQYSNKYKFTSKSAPFHIPIASNLNPLIHCFQKTPFPIRIVCSKLFIKLHVGPHQPILQPSSAPLGAKQRLSSQWYPPSNLARTHGTHPQLLNATAATSYFHLDYVRSYPTAWR